MGSSPQLLAIVGGSGAGKSWLADRLQEMLGDSVATISLDSFYRDRSRLQPSRRPKLNFDHPRAIDWAGVWQVLEDCRHGRPVLLPQYDFSNHVRLPMRIPWLPKPLVVVEGLWVLYRPELRRLFALSVYLDCPAKTRLQRRLERDCAQRGRSRLSVYQQFRDTVEPMHQRFVSPQAQWADLVLKDPIDEPVLNDLADRLRGMLDLERAVV